MARFRSEELRRFVDRGEKAPPPVFVGRGELIAEIHRMARSVWSDNDAIAHGEAGAAMVLQGAAGAGKTSIVSQLSRISLDEIAAAAEGAGGSAHPPTRVVTIPANTVAVNPQRTLAVLAAAAGAESDRWMKLGKSFIKGSSVNLAGVTLKRANGSAAPPPSDIGAFADQYPSDSWQAPVIMAIDEAQRPILRPDAPGTALLQELYDNSHNLPISVLFVGLGNTADRIGALDLSRVMRIRTLGGLSRMESRTLMRKFCETFGVGIQGHEHRLNRLADMCDGWPRHLHNALQALGRELLKPEVKGDPRPVNWARVASDLQTRRREYYRGQYSREMELEAPTLTAEIMAGLGDGMSGLRIMSRIRTLSDSIADGYQRPEGMDDRSFFAHLVHKGALQGRPAPVGETTIYHCPIPSFQSYLVDAGNFPIAAPYLPGSGDPNEVDVHGRTALHRAAGAGDSLAVQSLLKRDVAVNARDNENRTPLHLAADCQEPTLIAALCCADAEPAAEDATGATPVRRAAFADRADNLDIMLGSMSGEVQARAARPVLQCLRAENDADISDATMNLLETAGAGKDTVGPDGHYPNDRT